MDCTAKLEFVQEAIEKVEANRLKHLENIRHITSCPDKFPRLAGKQEEMECQTNRRFDEMTAPLLEQMNTLKAGVSSKETSTSMSSKNNRMRKQRREGYVKRNDDKKQERETKSEESEEEKSIVIQIEDSDSSIDE